MLLIFDLDGTLFQAKQVVLLAVQRLFGELGIQCPDDYAILKNAGRGAYEMLFSVLPESIALDYVMPLYVKHMRSAIEQVGELFPGVRDVLEQLHAEGHTLALCSKSPNIYIEAVLAQTGITCLFARCCSSEAHPSKASAIRELLGQGDGSTVPKTGTEARAAVPSFCPTKTGTA